MKTLVTEIERFSTHDGFGVRTVIFLKGCPLNCAWCHNPECISPEKEEMFYEEKCISCGKCEYGCYTGARVICGKEMSASEVIDKALLDKGYYGDDGGITISGGEPLYHRDFTLQLIKLAKEKGLNVGIETSLYRYDEEILSSVDLIMTDVKIFDEELHKKYVGVSNKEILKNIERADALGKPIIVRTPIIRLINDNKENVENTANFLRGLNNVIKYELLPYHPLGLTKAKALNKPMQKFESPTKEELEELEKYARL